MSTIVEIQGVWLNLASDPSDYCHFEFARDLKRTKVQPGKVQPMAGGRLRLVRTVGRSKGLSFSLQACTRAQLDWLEDHLGETVCARDDEGHKFFAVYLIVSVDEHNYNDEGESSLDLSELSFSEAV